MKVLLLTLLLLLLCSAQVLTLSCYTCDNEEDHCKTPKDCDEEHHWCKTVERAGDIIFRGCVTLCNEEDVFTTCCRTDLCEN